MKQIKTVWHPNKPRSYDKGLLLAFRHRTFPLQHYLVLARVRLPARAFVFLDGLKIAHLNLFLCCQPYKVEKKQDLGSGSQRIGTGTDSANELQPECACSFPPQASPAIHSATLDVTDLLNAKSAS